MWDRAAQLHTNPVYLANAPIKMLTHSASTETKQD